MHPRLLFSEFSQLILTVCSFLIIILSTGSQCRVKLNLTLWSKRISLCIPIPEWDVKWQMCRAILKMCKEEAMSSVKSDKSFGLSDKKRVFQERDKWLLKRSLFNNSSQRRHTRAGNWQIGQPAHASSQSKSHTFKMKAKGFEALNMDFGKNGYDTSQL